MAPMLTAIETPRSCDIESLLADLQRCTDAEQRAQLEEQVVLTSLPLAESVARRYSGRGVEPDDLAQVARMALVKAVRRYQPGLGSGFAAFAVPTISGELKRHFRDCGWSVRPPRRLQEFKARMNAQEERLLHELHREPTVEDIAAAMQVSPEHVREARLSAAAYSALSLDAPAPGSQTRPELEDAAPDEYAVLDMREALRGAVATLSARDRQLLKLRFVDERTQSEIGQILGVSQMQVSRLLAALLAHLRAQLLGNEEQVVRTAVSA